MDDLQEPSTYIIDSKKPEYYRNRSNNNCASRIRLLNKIPNHVVSIQNILNQLDDLENQKDFHFEKSRSLDDIKFFLNDLKDSFELYKEDLNKEIIELKSMDFEKIINDNISKIKQTESDKKCNELK